MLFGDTRMTILTFFLTGDDIYMAVLMLYGGDDDTLIGWHTADTFVISVDSTAMNGMTPSLILMLQPPQVILSAHLLAGGWCHAIRYCSCRAGIGHKY